MIRGCRNPRSSAVVVAAMGGVRTSIKSVILKNVKHRRVLPACTFWAGKEIFLLLGRGKKLKNSHFFTLAIRVASI